MPVIGKNRLIALYVFVALGVYVWTIFGLRPLVIKNGQPLNVRQFQDTHSSGKWLVPLHNGLSYLAFWGAMLGGPLLASAFFNTPVTIAPAAWLAVSGWNLFNGIYG